MSHKNQQNAPITNEKLTKCFDNNFNLVNHAIKMAVDIIKSKQDLDGASVTLLVIQNIIEQDRQKQLELRRQAKLLAEQALELASEQSE